jgi:hypothetical protein
MALVKLDAILARNQQTVGEMDHRRSKYRHRDQPDRKTGAERAYIDWTGGQQWNGDPRID